MSDKERLAHGVPAVIDKLARLVKVILWLTGQRRSLRPEKSCVRC